MADLPTSIPFVFANTRIEFDAITEFVDNYDYGNIVKLTPRKPFGQILKEYGKPAISKLKSELLRTYQKNMRNEPLKYYRVKTLIIGKVIRNGEMTEERSRFALAEKHFHFLHPELGYNVANKCCNYMKKLPFKDYEKEAGMKGAFTGVRTAEGGVRASVYTSYKQTKGDDYTLFMPIIDWSDEVIDEFITAYNVKLSKAYTEYGLTRTGCVGCPFSRNLAKELKVTYDYEPLRYKAVMKWLGDVYIDQGVKLEFDAEYMKKFEERNARNERLRREMVDKYRYLRKGGDKPSEA